MSESFNHEYTRRDFLRLSGTLAAGVALPVVLQACNSDSNSNTGDGFPQPQTLGSVNGVLDITLNLAYLDTTLNGTKVQIWAATGATNQKWTFVNEGSGQYGHIFLIVG